MGHSEDCAGDAMPGSIALTSDMHLIHLKLLESHAGQGGGKEGVCVVRRGGGGVSSQAK